MHANRWSLYASLRGWRSYASLAAAEKRDLEKCCRKLLKLAQCACAQMPNGKF